MTTVVCTFINCPNRSESGFCKRDTVILEASPQGFIQCKTGLIDIYERNFPDVGKNEEQTNREDKN